MKIWITFVFLISKLKGFGSKNKTQYSSDVKNHLQKTLLRSGTLANNYDVILTSKLIPDIDNLQLL